MKPFVLWLALVLVPVGALAHQKSVSYSRWVLQGREASVRLQVAELDLTRIPPELVADADPGRYLRERLVFASGSTPCSANGPLVVERPEPGWLVFRWSVRCPLEGALRLRSTLFAETSSQHLHFVRVEQDGRTEERFLSDREREWRLSGDEGGPAFGLYVVLGVEHILAGTDHLAFLLALLLAATSLGALARVVTGFTVGHSLTLALAATGMIVPDAAPVEALIGLSIVLVAAENLWLAGPRGATLPAVIAVSLLALAAASAAGIGRVPPVTLLGLALFSCCTFALLERLERPGATRGTVSFLFGMLHGFGFASVLTDAGLPQERLLAALLGFNLGVEAGQLAVVALLWIGLTRSPGRWRQIVLEAGSASVLALGTFWFVMRSFG